MYNTANNSFGKLESSIWPSATSFIMQSQYSDLFPDHIGVDYFLKLEQKNELQEIVKREIVLVTNKAGDIFTITRGAWFCPASDTATTQTNTSFSFNAGDSVSLTVVSEHIQQMETDIATLQTTKANDNVVVKLTGDQTIAWVKTFSSSPIVPIPTTDMQVAPKKYVDDSIVSASNVEALVDKDTYILWEDCLVNDSLFPETAPTFAESTLVQNIGDVTENTRVALYDFGSGVAGNTMKLALRKFVSPSADLSIRLETVDGIIIPAVVAITWTYTALASSEFSASYEARKWFDWITSSNTVGWAASWTTWWLRILLPSAVKIYKYRIFPRGTGITDSPTAWTFEGSNNGSTWTTLDTQTGISWWVVGTFKEFPSIFTTNFLYYRINITASGTGYAWVDELQLFRVDDNGTFCNNNMLGMLTANTTTSVSSQDAQISTTEIIPTGTLVNANATATVTAASLTTSLVDTTITFALSFAITLGQKYAIVLNQVGDVVNATNYYGVGYVDRNTTTRLSKIWNGTTRTIRSWPTKTSTVALWTNIWQQTMLVTYNIIPLVKVRVFNMTTWFTLNWWWYVNTSFTWTNLILENWTTYTLTKNYVNGFITTVWTITGNDLSITVWSSFIVEALSIQTESVTIFPYTSSPLSLPTVLLKTSATYSYKLPTDFPRIANEAKSAGQSVITTFLWLKWWFTGLSNTTYYASNTPWSISATAGTNPYVVGNGIDTTTLKIDWKNLNKAITVSASPFSYTNTTGWPIQVRVTGGTVNPIVINGVTVATATWIINTLPAWAEMTVTYTVLPTITYSDL